MAKELKDWLDEFVENGANPKDVTNWPEETGGGGDDPQLVQSLKDFAIADLHLYEDDAFTDVIKSGKTKEDVLQQYLDARIYFGNDTAAQVIKLDSVSNMLEEYIEYNHLVEIKGQYKVDLDKLKALILKTCGGDITIPTNPIFIGFTAMSGDDFTMIQIISTNSHGGKEIDLFDRKLSITNDAPTVISVLEDEQVIQFFNETIIDFIDLNNVQVLYDHPYKFTAIKIDDFLDIFVEVEEPKTLGQDLKDYVESLTNPTMYLSTAFKYFLTHKGVDVTKTITLGDTITGLSNTFYMEARAGADLNVIIMGWESGMGYGTNTLEDFLDKGNDGDGLWYSVKQNIKWQNLDKPINLSITIGGTNYEIENISLDEIKTFIKEKQVVEEGGGGVQK